MPTCSFCKKNYEAPRGLTVFTFDGRSVYFCSSKCKRNADLKRDPKKVNWIRREKKIKENKKVIKPKKVSKKMEKEVEEIPQESPKTVEEAVEEAHDTQKVAEKIEEKLESEESQEKVSVDESNKKD